MKDILPQKIEKYLRILIDDTLNKNITWNKCDEFYKLCRSEVNIKLCLSQSMDMISSNNIILCTIIDKSNKEYCCYQTCSTMENVLFELYNVVIDSLVDLDLE